MSYYYIHIPPYPKYLMDRSSIQRVCTTKNARGKRITEDYKSIKTRKLEYTSIPGGNVMRNNHRYGMLQLIIFQGKI